MTDARQAAAPQAPLVPTDVDLRGLEYMPLLGARLMGSDFNACATDAEWRGALTLWWSAWNQVPAGSLPTDDVILCRLAGMGRDIKSWRVIKLRALHGFVLCDDGRLYHRVLCEQALVAWEKRVKERQRKAKWRGRKPPDEGGGAEGRDGPVLPPVPRDKTGTGRGQDGDGDGDREGTKTGTAASCPVLVPADGTGRDETGRDVSIPERAESAPPPPAPARAREAGADGPPGVLGGGMPPRAAGVPEGAPDDPPEAGGQRPTLAGAACRAIRAAGIADVNPSHPELLRLLDAGVSPEALTDTAAELVRRGRGGFALLLGTVAGRLRDAAAASAAEAAAGAAGATGAPQPRPAPAPQPDEPEWRREQRERNEAFLGPYSLAAKRAGRGAVVEVVDMEAGNGVA